MDTLSTRNKNYARIHNCGDTNMSQANQDVQDQSSSHTSSDTQTNGTHVNHNDNVVNSNAFSSNTSRNYSQNIPSHSISPTTSNINIPMFCTLQPQRWFNLLEMQFHNFHINDESDKFNVLLSKLNSDTIGYAMDEASDAIISVQPYTNTKNRLLAACSQNQENSWDQIESLQLGDRKPSTFLRELFVKNSSAQMPVSRLRVIFIRAMPSNIGLLLRSKTELPLNELALLADQLIVPIPNYSNSYVVNAMTSSNQRHDHVGVTM